MIEKLTPKIYLHLESAGVGIGLPAGQLESDVYVFTAAAKAGKFEFY